MNKRVFACLIAKEGEATREGIAVAALDHEEALKIGQARVDETMHGAIVVAVLNQEDHARLGMLLAAGRVALEAEQGR